MPDGSVPIVNNPRFGFEFTELIPEISKWNNGRGVDVVTWVEAETRIEHAIAYGNVFWPEFVEYDDCVLRDDFKIEVYEGFMEQTHRNKAQVERVMNHIHVMDMYYGKERTDAQLLYMGRLLKDIWQAKLNRDFPGRKIEVHFYEEDVTDPSEYQLTFFQPRQ